MNIRQQMSDQKYEQQWQTRSAKMAALAEQKALHWNGRNNLVCIHWLRQTRKWMRQLLMANNALAKKL